MKNIKKYSIIFILFMLVIIIMFVFSLLLDTTNIKSKQDFDEFEKNINLVLEKINKIYITNGEYVGIRFAEYPEKDNYKKEIEDIKKIYNKDILTEDYFLLDANSKEKLELKDLKYDYIVNYKDGETYCLNPIRYNGKIYYTTLNLEMNIKDNKNYSYNIPIIPEGFRYVTGDWNTGFVITDINGNEFVWVPVGWLNQTKPTDALKKYYDSFSSEKIETEEYKAIKNSIDKYGGFYIGRYEASLKGATDKTCEGEYNILQIKKNIMPISNMSYSTNEFEYTYYNMYTGLLDINIPRLNSDFYGYTEKGVLENNNIKEVYDENSQSTVIVKENIKGALEMARSMSADYNWNNSLHTTLIYAEQLDTLLKIIENKNLLDDKKIQEANVITENNVLWGNFIDSEFRYSIDGNMYTKSKNEGVLLPTGVTTYKIDEDLSDNRNQVFNIYDLAGNLQELTMEQRLDMYIIVRGGSFDNKGSKNISNYERIVRNEAKNNIGIRVVMYID